MTRYSMALFQNFHEPTGKQIKRRRMSSVIGLRARERSLRRAKCGGRVPFSSGAPPPAQRSSAVRHPRTKRADFRRRATRRLLSRRCCDFASARPSVPRFLRGPLTKGTGPISGATPRAITPMNRPSEAARTAGRLRCCQAETTNRRHFLLPRRHEQRVPLAYRVTSRAYVGGHHAGTPP